MNVKAKTMNGVDTFFYYGDRILLVVMILFLAFAIYRGKHENERENAYHSRLIFIISFIFLGFSRVFWASWIGVIFMFLTFTSFFAILIIGTSHLKK